MANKNGFLKIRILKIKLMKALLLAVQYDCKVILFA